MTQKALSTLDFIIQKKPTRENRLTVLLREPYAETETGWYMYVPTCFNDALDIKQTERVKDKTKCLVWTQGSWFSFKRGDTLYDTPDAYKVWSEALKSIKLCIQIKTATSAGPLEGSSDRFPGSVTFSIMTPNKNRSKLVEVGEHTMSQDGFIRFLIAGPPEELKRVIGVSQQQ